jgi:hypothetical protein
MLANTKNIFFINFYKIKILQVRLEKSRVSFNLMNLFHIFFRNIKIKNLVIGANPFGSDTFWNHSNFALHHLTKKKLKIKCYRKGSETFI